MIVLGGGPAGAVSAWLAARDGLSVLLVDPATSDGRIEGLSPRLHRWLHATGIGDGGAALGPFPRQVDWAGQPGSANGEFAVDRGRFDAHLRAAAQDAGAQVVCVTARLSGREVTLADGRSLTARWILDARGRRSRRAERGTPPFSTISICGWYKTERCPAPGFAISALPQGWLWRATLPDGRIWAQLTCDAREGAPMEARLSDAVARCLAGAGATVQDGPLTARASAPALPVPVADLTCLPIGDALAAMDPLSGHGMFWAVSSALAAAAARRTLSARPGPQTEALCRRYLGQRAHETYMRNARIGRDFLALETRFAGEPFWASRAGFPDAAPAHDPIVQAGIRPGFAVRDGMIEEMDILHTPQHPEGVGWFGTIPAAPFWRDLAAGRPRGELAETWGPAALGLVDGLGPLAAQAGRPAGT